MEKRDDGGGRGVKNYRNRKRGREGGREGGREKKDEANDAGVSRIITKHASR